MDHRRRGPRRGALLRARSGAVVVGAGTVAVDDPSLDGASRRVPGPSSRSACWSTRRVGRRCRAGCSTGEAQAGDRDDRTGGREPWAAWTAAGADVLTRRRGPFGVSMPALMRALGERDVLDVLIEGGSELAWTSVEERVVDRLVLYMAPKVVGGRAAPGVLGGDGVATIGDAIGAFIESVEMVGEGSPHRGGPEGGGGRCSPGSLRSAAASSASTERRSVGRGGLTSAPTRPSGPPSPSAACVSPWSPTNSRPAGTRLLSFDVGSGDADADDAGATSRRGRGA